MKTTYSIIPHVHWDREWYFTERKSLLYLLHDLDEVLEVLDKNKEIEYFLFDAQTSIIDDYLRYREDKKELLYRLVRERRLLIGPWYTQCDQMIIHGESIVRNLLYGTRRAKEIGNCFNVGYAVDCFGQAAQMPQIYSGFGINYTLFKRGIETAVIPSNEFIWKSDDGSNIFAYHCIDYLNFRNPSDNTDKNVEAITKLAQSYKSRSLSGKTLLFNGFDQHPIRKDIDKIKQELTGKGFSVDMKPVDEVLEEVFKVDNLPVYNGELTCGETGRVHKSIYSSRADLKILNSKCENKLIKTIEPLQAIIYNLTGKEEKKLIKEQWKLLMENSAHDSIGCCNSDEVNRQIKSRFDLVLDTLNEYENLSYRLIAKQIKQSNYGIQVYNYLPYERVEEIHMKVLTPYKTFSLSDTKNIVYPVKINNIKEVSEQVLSAAQFSHGVNGNYKEQFQDSQFYEADITALVTVPAMGYETFDVIEEKETIKKEKKLENEYLKIDVLDNGSLDIYDKQSDYHYTKNLIFEDGADAGDSYDYSSTTNDYLISTQSNQIKNLIVDGRTASYDTTMLIPLDLDARVQKKFNKELKIHVELVLQANKPQVNFKVTIGNNATDHRLRVLFKTDINSDYSYADQTFGVIKRPTYLPQVETWKEKKWHEKPRTIEPMQSYVYLKNEERMVGVISDSVKEYEIIGDGYDTIAYTLYRSFSKMGRADLDDRPGRASGMEWDTPDAMLLKEMEFTFALCFPTNETKLADYANEYTTPFKAHQEAHVSVKRNEFILSEMDKNLPDHYSSFTMNKTSKLSIYKVGEDKGTIVRVYQIEEGIVNIESDNNINECSLDEYNDIEFNNDKTYKRNEIITLRLEKKYE